MVRFFNRIFGPKTQQSQHEQTSAQQDTLDKSSQGAVLDMEPQSPRLPTDALKTILQDAVMTSKQAEHSNDQTATSAVAAAWERVVNHPSFPSLDAIWQGRILSSAGSARQRCYRTDGQLDDLDQAVTWYQQAVKCALPASPQLADTLDSLGSVLHDRYRLSKQPADLDAAIDAFRRAASASPGSSQLARSLHNLGIGLRDRYMASEHSEDLDESILVFRQAAELVATDAGRQARYLMDLGCVLRLRAANAKDNADLQEAIEVFRRCVDLTPSDTPGSAGHLLNLCNTLRERYERDGHIEDLDEVISLLQRLITQAEPPAIILLVQLGTDQYRRYEQKGEQADLEAAVGAVRHAAEAAKGGPDSGTLWASLGKYLLELYDRTGDSNQLNESIEVCCAALRQTPDGTTEMSARLDVLGRGMRKRFSALGNSEDLDESIRALRKATQNAVLNSSEQLSYLNNLGNSLFLRYELNGVEGDLAELVAIRRSVVEQTPIDSPSRPGRINNLGLVLRTLFNHTGKVEDIDATVTSFREAARLAASPDFLGNLGGSLRDRFKLVGRMADLDEAVLVLREAVEQTPIDSPLRPLQLVDLAETLRCRQSSTDVEEGKYLDEAVQLALAATSQMPLHSSDLPVCLNILGNCLSDRYACCGQTADLDGAVVAYRQAAMSVAETSPNLPTYLNNLATALADRYQAEKRDEDWQGAQIEFQRAFELGKKRTPHEAVRSAANWLRWSFMVGAWDAVVEAYRASQECIDFLMGRQLNRADKAAWLKTVQGFSSCAAYALAKLDRRTEAVTALEDGRTRLLSEAMEQDRRNLQRLNELGHSATYPRYCQTSERLQALVREGADVVPPTDLPASGYLAVRQVHEAAQRDFSEVVADIRKIPGYEDFLSGTPSLAKIRRVVPGNAWLVYFVSTALGGLALAVPGAVDQDVVVVWLDRLTDAAICEQLLGSSDRTAERGYLGAYAASMASDTPAVQECWSAAIRITAYWLWEVLMEPVVTQLRPDLAHNPPVANQADQQNQPLDCLILVPGGLLGLMPLHLASRRLGSEDRCVLEDFIVSYAPSAQALGISQMRAGVLAEKAPSLLAIANTRGDLPFSTLEVQQIANCFRSEAVRTLEGSQATQEALMQELPTRTYLHFACHGRYDPGEALSSGLILADNDPLELREILDRRFILDDAQLVTLSACESGLFDVRRLPDEVIGLPVGFVQAGAPSVVSTLWAVNDVSTSLLMIEFYRLHLVKGQTPAEALRGAQLWLRRAKASEMHLAEHFERLYVSSRKPDAKAKALHAQRYWERNPDSVPFTDPYYWGAFVVTGGLGHGRAGHRLPI